MSLKPFTYPFPETRFFHAGLNVYKFKIRYGDSISLPSTGEEIENKEAIIQELEDSIRAVLGNLDNLQPFVTEHLIIFPYKSKWERVSHLKFKHGEIILVPYPFVFTLYVEMKCFNENLPPGKPVNSIALELIFFAAMVALKIAFGKVKVLAEKKATEALMRKRKLMDEPHSPSRRRHLRAKMETSSQDSSKKKPALETRRKKKEVQPECQEIPTSKTTDVQEEDSKWGPSLPGPIIPPLKQKTPPLPKGLGTSGFFGFLSTLFPFRYFFRKSSQ